MPKDLVARRLDEGPRLVDEKPPVSRGSSSPAGSSASSGGAVGGRRVSWKETDEDRKRAADTVVPLPIDAKRRKPLDAAGVLRLKMEKLETKIQHAVKVELALLNKSRAVSEKRNALAKRYHELGEELVRQQGGRVKPLPQIPSMWDAKPRAQKATTIDLSTL